MAGLFLKLINMSFTASWLIMAIIIVRLFFKKMPKWVNCVLWAVVAFRLVCPFTIESVTSLVPNAEPLPEKIITGSTFEINTGVGIVDRTANEYLGDHYFEGVTVPENRGADTMEVLAVIWLLGLAAMAAYGVFSYYRVYRLVKPSMHSTDNIWICDEVQTPFILGVIRPRIYLPSNLRDNQTEYVIAHEKAHLKRHDHWWKPFGFMLLSVYWFNPLCWAAYILFCRDIEMACDECVVKEMSLDSRKEYSKALLSCSTPQRMIEVCPLAFGEVGVKERVKAVLNYRKPSFWIILILIIAVPVVIAAFATNPVTEDEDEPLEAEGFMFDDRHFMCECEISDEAQQKIYDYYYYRAMGDYDKLSDYYIGNTDDTMLITFKNDKEAFERGEYYLDMVIHELNTLSNEDVQNASASNIDYITATIRKNELTDYVIVRVDETCKYNENLLNAAQVPDGRRDRYYMLGKRENDNNFRIYNIFWDYFFADESGEATWEEYIKSKKEGGSEYTVGEYVGSLPLNDALPYGTYMGAPKLEQLYLLDETADGDYSLYGISSKIFDNLDRSIAFICNNKNGGRYIVDDISWPWGYELPRIVKYGENDVYLTQCVAGGTGCHIDELTYYKMKQDGTLEGYVLEWEDAITQIEKLVRLELDTERNTLRIYNTEGGKSELFAEKDYTYELNGQEPNIQKVFFSSMQFQIIPEPAMAVVGIGLEIEESVIPIYIEELAFNIGIETDGQDVRFVLHDASTYDVIMEMVEARDVLASVYPDYMEIMKLYTGAGVNSDRGSFSIDADGDGSSETYFQVINEKYPNLDAVRAQIEKTATKNAAKVFTKDLIDNYFYVEEDGKLFQLMADYVMLGVEDDILSCTQVSDEEWKITIKGGDEWVPFEEELTIVWEGVPLMGYLDWRYADGSWKIAEIEDKF